ncbi:MAG: alpha-mannosidase [Cellulosilyticaceae bacterium]
MKTAHIISHSHWDREWYLPYEKHHMLLIEFMDTLIETLENDSDYRSFHLDGQTILLEDYLQVRPENKERLKKLIQDKRIAIGPWYVLQDEFLTSSEANIRNLQMGHQVAKEYGDVCKVGYFPDSFGNMGQAPQILKKAGIDTAVFGRGVKPTGFNNQVGESYESPYSEMYWEAADGSRVLGILFANWYSNGIEVPKDEALSKQYWDKKIPDAERYASTKQLLFMNGCDHQPVQTDLSEAIRTAEKLYPEVKFVHSNFIDYIAAVKNEIPEDLTVIKGELRSQETDGWYTLANTASARVYIKQMNAKCQMLFEKVAEPLATMAYQQGKDYPHHLFTYGWKTLMENHPHDSICGCSVDAVHQEMVTRFNKAEQVALHIIEESKQYLASKINLTCFEKYQGACTPFVVFNTTGWERTGTTTTTVEVMKKYFGEPSVPEIVAQMHEIVLPKYKVIDASGNEVQAKIEVLPNAFNYDLPKDRFRQPYIAKCVKVTFLAKQIPSYGWDTFALVPVEASKEQATFKHESLIKEHFEGQNNPLNQLFHLETDAFNVTIRENGSLQVADKTSGKVFDNLCIYEDHGDIGNEYIYRMPIGEQPITTKNCIAGIRVLEDTAYRAVVEVNHTMMIPSKIDAMLDREIADLIEFKERHAKRSEELVPLTITTNYTFEKHGKAIQVKTTFNNKALDHRLRVFFETKIETPYHYADSIFEVAKRNNTPSLVWENPCHAQHQQAFVNVHDEACGLTVANKGLCEYEILQDGMNTIAVTLHRGVRELGDWGVFLTPDAQCIGEHTVEFEIIPHGRSESLYQSYEEAYQYQVDWTMAEIGAVEGNLKPKDQLLQTHHLGLIPSSLKVSPATGDIVGRWYNIKDETQVLAVKIQDTEGYKTDLLEQVFLEKIDDTIVVAPKEIMTVGFKVIND